MYVGRGPEPIIGGWLDRLDRLAVEPVKTLSILERKSGRLEFAFN